MNTKNKNEKSYDNYLFLVIPIFCVALCLIDLFSHSKSYPTWEDIHYGEEAKQARMQTIKDIKDLIKDMQSFREKFNNEFPEDKNDEHKYLLWLIKETNQSKGTK